jgi:hypothetical protein
VSVARPLFVTGTARSGSNLLARMLDAHPDATVACDPFFPLFPPLRDALVAASADPAVRASLDPGAPLQDYYGTDARIRLLDAVQAGDLDVPLPAGAWAALRPAIARRMRHDCADLIPHLPEVAGPTYRALVADGLRLIEKARDAAGRAWVGFKDVWIVEFFRPLARAFPDARFLVIVRDPRAVVASMHAIERIDATQVAHTLSYARHWRKGVAFAEHYQGDPALAGRLRVVAYEDLVRAPEPTARGLCEFLGIPFVPAMLDASRYPDYATVGTWAGNSSFEAALGGISPELAERWRTALEPGARKLVELVCGPEMRRAGYAPDGAGADRADGEAFAYLVRNGRQPLAWRSDLGDPLLDYGLELGRAALLAAPLETLDGPLVRRAFLFEDVFRRLRTAAAGIGASPAPVGGPTR